MNKINQFNLYYFVFILSFTLFSLLSSISFAQGSRTNTYYDENWKELTLDTTSWKYKRETLLLPGKTLLFVTDYYRNGKKQMTGSFTQLEPEIKEGDFVWYYENGQVMKKAQYIQNKQEGIEEEFTETGTPLFIRHFQKGNLQGNVTAFRKNGKKWIELYFEKDSLIPEKNRVWDENGKEIEYEKYLKKTDKKAQAYARELKQNIVPPTLTMPEPLNLNQVKNKIIYKQEECPAEGKVFCRLSIDQYGKVVSYTILRTPHECLTKAVEPHLKKIYFLPARSSDAIVPAEVTLPFSFRVAR